jgi:TolB protein
MKPIIAFTGVLLTVLSSCDADNQICPAPSISLPNPPYDEPTWHPSGKIIGFNHIPIKEIIPGSGTACGLQPEYIFDTDSLGFWLINEDGTDQRRVLPYAILSPSWSPDGNWLAFSKGAQIFKVPFDGIALDTTKAEQLTFEGRNFFPTWSPDGCWIAYDSDNDSSSGEKFIWKMRNDGSSARRIAYVPEEGEIRSPFWGTNSNIIHYRYLAGTDYANPEIFEMDSAGQNVRRITFSDQAKSQPQYSFDGQTIAYLGVSGTSGFQIFITNSKESCCIQITTSGAGKFSFSPDGRIVYLNYNYQTIDHEKGTLWIMDQVGGNRKQLTFNRALPD